MVEEEVAQLVVERVAVPLVVVLLEVGLKVLVPLGVDFAVEL